MLGEDTQARAALTQVASATPGAEPLGPGLDYLVSCSYNTQEDRLLLMAGTTQGAVGCFPVLEPTQPGAACGFGSPQAIMSGAHDSVGISLSAFACNKVYTRKILMGSCCLLSFLQFVEASCKLSQCYHALIGLFTVARVAVIPRLRIVLIVKALLSSHVATVNCTLQLTCSKCCR